MKKIFLGLAALSLLSGALSCNRETAETATDGKGEISFRTVLGKQTISRATEITTTGLQGAANTPAAGIPVKVFDDAASDPTTPWNSWSLYYDNTNSVWTYGTPVLQPQLSLVYYAWYPNTPTSFARNASKEASFNYAVKAVDSQEDLIAASVDATNSTAITLQFSHLLSQINFAVQEVSDVQVVITKIELKNIGNTAKYTFGTGWDTPSATAAYEYALETTDFPTALGSAIVPLGSGSASDANALMLMPQSFGASSTAVFEISFKLLVKGTGGAPDVYYAGTASTDVTATANLKDFNTTTWDPGKRYIYLIDFTNYIADKYIKFTVVSVDGWLDNNGGKQIAVEVAQANKPSLEGAIASLASYITAGIDAIQITVTDKLTENIVLAIDGTSFSTGNKIHIYFKGGVESSKTITATGWTSNLDGNTCTLTKN